MGQKATIESIENTDDRPQTEMPLEVVALNKPSAARNHGNKAQSGIPGLPIREEPECQTLPNRAWVNQSGT